MRRFIPMSQCSDSPQRATTYLTQLITPVSFGGGGPNGTLVVNASGNAKNMRVIKTNKSVTGLAGPT